jgi:hypothetical protein
VRESSAGLVLSAPLIHNPEFEVFTSRTIEATCYDHDHPAPAPGCRCGLYAALEGTLDSLPGYLLDSAHDRDTPIYAEVACSGRLFVDARGVRAERLEVLKLATSPTLWPDQAMYDRVAVELGERYGIEILDIEAVPQWLLMNVLTQGAPEHLDVDLDALLVKLGVSTTPNSVVPNPPLGEAP